MKGDPVKAAQYLLRGFKLLPEPGIRPYVIIPLLLNITIFIILINYTVNKFSGWSDQLIAMIPEWLGFLSWILWPLFILLLLLIIIYSFTIVANFVASPFNGFLAEKIELHVSGQKIEGNNDWRSIIMLVPRSLMRELAKLMCYLPWAIGLGILTFIPAINTAAPLLWFILGAWMMSVQYVDYPMDNHDISIADLKQKLRLRSLSSLGFGSAVMVATLIPLVNLVVIPAAICGATLFWLEELKDNPEV